MATPLPLAREAQGPHAGVVTCTLEQPGKPVVVLDHDLLQRLEVTLKSLATGEMARAGITGFVLRSASDRAFVAGADLKSIAPPSLASGGMADTPGLGDDALHAYLLYASRVYALVADLPFPTVAAINGAALGGGLELAMHCDALVGAPPPARDGQPGKPYPVGLPEAGLGICPGWGGTTLLPARIDPFEAIKRTCAGTTFTYDEAASAGLFDRVAPTAADLLPTCLALIAEMNASFAGAPVPGAPGLTMGAGDARRRDRAPYRWGGRPRTAAATLQALDRAKAELPASLPPSQAGPTGAVLDAIEKGLTRGWDACLAAEQDHLVRLRHTPEAKKALEAFFARGKK